MLWKGRRQSGNVQDVRGMGRGGLVLGGGLGTIVVVVLALLFGKNPMEVLQSTDPNATTQQTAPINDEASQFVRVVLADNEDVWNKIFADMGKDYPEPVLVLFRDAVQSGCGGASAAMGPFYCPSDHKMYIDLSFYDELKNRFNAPGDFAMAYVIAHENGHHIQNVLGISDQVTAMRGKVSEEEYNKLSVRLELQADFLAGVWAHHAQQMKNVLEEGDIEEALNAANAIGDDKLQKQSQGYVVPDAFTHGTSEQRMRWFKQGFDTGDIRQGDTFTEVNL